MVEKKSPKKESAVVTKKAVAKKTAPKKVEVVAVDSYAIFKNGGKQYQAVVGKTLALEKIAGEPGEKVSFDEVLLRKAGDDVEIGMPHVKGASIKASIIKHDKEAKVIVFHFKRRKKSRVKKGHRQPLTVVRIESI